MAQFNVTTTGINVTLNDLGITLNHPSTINLYDDGGDNKFTPSEIMDSLDLQDALDNSLVTAANENGDPITQVTPDNFIANIPDLTTGYYEDRFTMEENGNLSNNNRQWSVGNGSVGVVNFNIKEAGEITAMGLHAEVLGSSVIIELMINNTPVATATFTGNQIITLSSPVSVQSGDLLGFRTQTVSGTFTDCRVSAWQRIAFLGVKGEKGDKGDDGTGGVPNTFARVVCASTPQVNNSAYTTIALNNTPTLNTAGISISSNEITVTPGTYEVKGIFSVTSSSQRPNQEVRMLIDSAEYSSEFGEGYIRNSSGHNESKITYTDMFTVNSNSTISFQARQISAAGTVTLDIAKSKVLIHKIA